MRTLPAWAEWNADAGRHPWTIGLEEEVMLVEAHTWEPAWRSTEIAGTLPAPLATNTSLETHACALELMTDPHPTVAEAAAQLTALRRVLRDRLAPLSLRAAVAGTHPLAVWSDTVVSRSARYHEIRRTMRSLAEREPTFALHVHVAVPGPDAAVRALDGLRRELPLLLALAANSPFWQGRDSGLASARTPVFSAFPRTGLPPLAHTYALYVAAIEPLVSSGAVPDPTFIWWDARLRPPLGTVEVRVMDAQTRIADAAALAALVQCLVYRSATGPGESAPGPVALAENRFLAARDGIAARLITPSGARLQPAADRLARLLWDCAPIADNLGCRAELESLTELVQRPGHVRQRALAARRGPGAIMPGLAAQFAGAETTAAGAPPRRWLAPSLAES